MLRINKLLKVFLFGLILFGYVACNKYGLNERVEITDGVSVLLPDGYKKNDLGDGNVLIRSKADASELRVVAVKDTSLDNLSPDKLKEGLEVNIEGFLQPMQGKLLSRKDTIIGKVVMSDFEFELGNGQAAKHGTGKFILKGNQFITFLVVAPTSEAKSGELLGKAFFKSIKIE